MGKLPDKLRGVCGSLLVALGVTQLYSFDSVIVGYFSAEENNFIFVWNYWVILLFGLGFFIFGFCLIRNEKFWLGSVILTVCFILFQGFSVYYYQIRILAEIKKNAPFEWSGTILFIAGILVLILLIMTSKMPKREGLTDQNWKTKWRYAAGFFSLIGAVTAVFAATIIFKQLHSDSIKEGYLFTMPLDAYFACFMAIIFIMVTILSWRKVSYLLIGILLGASFILFTNYLSVNNWIDFAKDNLSITFGNNERQVFGMQFLMGASALISSIFAYIAKK